MGHKTHPLGFRLGITQQHKSFWYTKFNTYAQLVKEDYEIRQIILNFFQANSIHSTGITQIVIDRIKNDEQINIKVQTAKPGMLVGKAGIGLETIDANLTKLFPKKKSLLHILEITNLYLHADLIADTLVAQLEDRLPFRRVMKGMIERLQEEKVKGIKIQIAGRLNGAEIARTEWLREGRIPLQTLKADIDYSYKIAKTTHGILGIKVWLLKKNSLLS